MKRTKEEQNKINKDYRYTFIGKIKRTYSQMYMRVSPNCKQYLSYKGLKICSKEDFITCSMRCPIFKKLYRAWMDSGWERRLSPSIDRIDGRKGYTLDNIRWITAYNNSARPRQRITVTKELKQNIFELRETGLFQADIGKKLGVSQTTVSQVLRGKYPDQSPDIVK
jgi:hypothetical protein